MLLVKNSLHYVIIIAFDSIQGAFLFKELKIKLILLNLKHGVQWSHSQACSLKKCTLPYTYFVFKSIALFFFFFDQKRAVRKMFEYLFIGSEHP